MHIKLFMLICAVLFVFRILKIANEYREDEGAIKAFARLAAICTFGYLTYYAASYIIAN